jgi:hypothetical protein
VVLDKDILERTPVLALLVDTINSPDKRSEPEKSKINRYDNQVAIVTTEILTIL